MNADIFYLDSDQRLVPSLIEGLRRHLHPALTVELHSLSSNERQVIDMAQRYVKLLQASIQPEKGFRLDLRVLEYFGYRFYIYVYYAFAYTASKKIEDLRAFLPAVALRNRMALVPSGLGRQLELNWSEQFTSPFKPLEMGGAAEVNFSDPAAVATALAQVAQSTRADLLQEIRAYASFRNPGEISLPSLARDMDVDLGFLQQMFQTGGIERAFYNQLACEIAPNKIAFDRWTKVILSVRNGSDISLSNLQAKIAGPVEIRPARIELDVPAQSAASVPISLKPTDRGEFPLELVLVLPDEQVFSPWLPVQHLWLECD